jgi:hypothetical protein
MSPYQIAPLTPEHEKEIRNREELAQQQAAERETILQSVKACTGCSLKNMRQM